MLPAFFFVHPETLIAVYVGCIFCSCRNNELDAVFYLWFCDEDQELYLLRDRITTCSHQVCRHLRSRAVIG
jgi:hypothetical protein